MAGLAIRALRVDRLGLLVVAVMVATAVGIGAWGPAGTVLGQEGLPPRPSGIDLLPSNTVAVFTCTDTTVLRERFAESSFMQMTQDPQLRPLVSALYGNVVDTLAQVQERLGVRFEEMLDLTAGELTIAAVAPPQMTPQLCVIADTDPLSPHVPRLLEELEAWVEDSGGTVSRESVQGMELTVCERVPGPLDRLVYFQQDSTLIFTTDDVLLAQMLLRWADIPDENDPGVLGDKQAFVVAMNNTAIRGDAGAQVHWWINPVDLAFSLARGRLDAQILLGVLPVLHVDDLLGIGGTIAFDDPLCDQVSEMHVFVSPPHEGVWEAVATRRGDCTPQSWIPADAASYMTGHVDTTQAMRAITTMVDTLNGDGATREQLRNGSLARRLGIDLRVDFWDHLTGRVTYVTWFEPKASLGAQRNLFGIQVRDPEQFRPVMEAVIERLGDRWTSEQFAGVTMRTIKPRDDVGEEGVRREDRGPSVLRPAQPQPVVALVDDCLLFADGPEMMKRAIMASLGQIPTLADDPDFDLVWGQLEAEAGRSAPVALTFSRPEPVLRNAYEVLQSPELFDLLNRRAQDSSFWKNVKNSLEQHPLPAFTVLERYLAPSGGVWTEVDTGWHYISLGLRRENSL